MVKRLNHFMLLLTVIAVVMTSAISATTAYADDGVPGGEPTEPGPVDEQPAVEESAPAETVEEILDQIPEGTELVVISEEGVEPLASQEAAQIILENDPMWCPGVHTPGDTECTAGDLNVTALLGAIALLPIADRTGAGTIYFTSNYAAADAIFDHDDDALSLITDLTIQGGWSGGSGGAFSLSGVTTFTNVPLTIVNWNGNVTLHDIEIDAANNSGYGLFVDNDGDVTLDNVSVHDTPLNAFFYGDGAILLSTGDVDITDSDFDDNAGNGLQVLTTGTTVDITASEFDHNGENGLQVLTLGTIDLNTVSASDNTLTGAYLDSCLYEFVTPGLCAGSGAVTITSATTNLFNDNGFDGLVVDAGGGIAIDHVQANSNGLSGAVLTSLDDDGTGNVTVGQSLFNGNSNATGLDILTGGSIALTTIDALSNDTGAILDTTPGLGAITVTDGEFGTTNSNSNTWTGLHAESGSIIVLDAVTASFNGTNGAYLTAEGDITVSGSTFNDNVHFNYPEDPGLSAASNGGDITLTNVTADGNVFGAGSVLLTKDSGVINVTGGQFNNNGTFGIQAQSQDGDITLSGVTASLNMVKGTYLAAYGLGNIFVDNSTFVENGSYGIYASTSEGDIDLDLVTVTGDNTVDDGALGPDNLTDYGAVLVTGNGGSVFVTDSAFNLNTEVGLRIVSSGPVSLDNVTADLNGANGVEVYSISTASPICPGDEVVNIAVTVDGGTFTNNGGYGLMVKPGPAGTLVFVTPSTFGGNGLGDYLLDLSDPDPSDDCGGHGDKPVDDSKGPKIVDVPSSGGPPVEQDCELFASTILRLPNGTWVNVGCPFAGFSNLQEVLQQNLPGKLGAGTNFAAAVNVSLTDEEGNTTIHEDGTVTINFKLPEGSRGRGYSILFWDPTLNDGQGGWVKLPLYEAGTIFPLNPDDPEDGRTILSGVQQIGDTITVTVNFPGVFVLVAR